ncbi:MAG: HEAT repeat domain-containing protein [Myxococcales bacterium]|nr:HEAT repeat domain-containing protein [Myxococcales bacterium]
MNNAFASEDGNFKRGAFKPVAIVVGILLVAGAGAFAFFGARTEAQSLSKEAVNKEIQEIQLLPKQEQIPRWRKWADAENEPRLRQEAFVHLAWAKDAQSLPSIAKGLSALDHTVRGVAAMALVDFGSPLADPAKPLLLKAVTEANSTDKPQICWALVALREPSAFDTIMGEYRLGHLAQIEKLDGYPAFDADLLASLVPIDKLAGMASDESDSVRQLVATTLSRDADPKWTDTLIKLVNDKAVEVAREAAVGLGKIGNEKATQPLVEALSKADKPSREKFLQALRDGMGANGLVLALKTVNHDKAESEKFQTKQIFDMLKELEDPRGGDALYQYVQTNSRAPAHWKVETGMRMAEIGDVRAAEVLGWRMSQDPLKLYNDVDWPELRRDDNERVFAARMLSDLAVLHPEKRDYLVKTAEAGVLDWVDPKNKPQPHANGMRFLAAVGTRRAVPLLEKWADPKEKLPTEGAQPPFPEEWATAQSALRYLGWTKEPGAWRILDKQLHRRLKKLDVSWDSLMQGGLTILGMTLRALGVGASDGFAQWGDPKAYEPLVKFAEEPMENEQARMEACFALSWVATDDQMKEVVKKIQANTTKSDPKSTFLRQCYLETVIHKPVPEATAGLIDLLSPNNPDIELRHQAARAIGMGGITAAMVPQIFAKLSDVSLKADATLALILGADADTAARAIATYNDPNTPAEAIEELKDVYNKTFGYWSDRNYETGDIARWVQNAEAIAHVKVHDQLQDWPRIILGRNLVESIEIDNGPHSMTRVQLRWRLLADAKSNNEVKRAEAIRILKFIKEKGVLMALRYEPAPLGEMARQAFFEVMNPKASAESVPESPKAQKQQQGGPPPGFNAGMAR